MTLLQLSYFCEVVKTMNFNEAARRLNVSQPTLSKAISSLEKELGVMMFERKGRHVELTKCGEIYYNEVEDALDKINTINSKIGEIAQSPDEIIHIAYNAPFGQGYIPEVIGRFLKLERKQGTTVAMKQARSKRIEESIEAGNTDIGFCSIEPGNPNLEYVPVMTQPMVIITSLEHPLAKSGAKEVQLKELEGEPFVSYVVDAGITPMIDKYMKDQNFKPYVFCTAQDERSISSFVMANFGVAMVAQVEELKEFPVNQIKLVEPECRRVVYMIYSRKHYRSPAVNRMIHYFKKQIQNKEKGMTTP